MRDWSNLKGKILIRILSLSGSPVEGASTDLLLQRLAESIKSNLGDDHQVEIDFAKINDLSFIPCQACGVVPEKGFCLYHDLDQVYKKLAECDCLLFGSPVYFDSVSAQSKMFIDRCNCFRPPDYNNPTSEHPFMKLLTHKRPGAMVLVGGHRGWFEGARRVIAGFFKWVEVTNEGMIQYATPDFTRRGGAIEDPAILGDVNQLGKKLAEAVVENLKDRT